MAIDFSKFDKKFDVEGLKKDVQDAAENGGGGTREEVPHGTYEVKIEKLELVESKKGDPMVTCWMRILKGDFKNSIIFMNQVITQGFQIHIANEFLRSLDSSIDIPPKYFEGYEAYADLLMDIHEDIDGQLEYLLKYDQNNKGYNTFEIVEVFEAE
jgi:hypothetical protein